jgi:hypothetical protein
VNAATEINLKYGSVGIPRGKAMIAAAF